MYPHHLTTALTLLAACATPILAQTSSSDTAPSASASATIFVPLSVPPLLSPYISRVSATLLGADACAATYALSIKQPIDLRATVTQGPSTYSASINFGGPNVASCNPFNTESVSCSLSGEFVMASARASASFSGSALSAQFYTVPLVSGAERLSATAGSCSTAAAGGSGSASTTMTEGSSGVGSSSGMMGAGAGSTSATSVTRSGNAGAPVAVVKVVYRVVVLPVVVAAML